MWNTIAGIVGLLLAVYGVADLIVRVCYRLLFASERDIVYMNVQGEDAEYRIRRLAMWRNLMPSSGYEWVILLPDDVPELQTLCAELKFSAYAQKDWMRIHKIPLQSNQDGV